MQSSRSTNQKKMEASTTSTSSNNQRQLSEARNERRVSQERLANISTEISGLRGDKQEYIQEQQSANANNEGARTFADTRVFNRLIGDKESQLLDAEDRLAEANTEISRNSNNTNPESSNNGSIQNEETLVSVSKAPEEQNTETGNQSIFYDDDGKIVQRGARDEGPPQGTDEEKAHVEQQVIGECGCSAAASAAKRLGLVDINANDRNLMDQIRQSAKPGSSRNQGMQVNEFGRGLSAVGFQDVREVSTAGKNLEKLAERAESNQEAVFLMVNASKLPVKLAGLEKKGDIGHIIELRGRAENGNYKVQDTLKGGDGMYELTPQQLREAMSALPPKDRNKAVIAKPGSEKADARFNESSPGNQSQSPFDQNIVNSESKKGLKGNVDETFSDNYQYESATQYRSDDGNVKQTSRNVTNRRA